MPDLGCGVVQGYGIGKPMPKDALIAWLETYAARDVGNSLSA